MAWRRTSLSCALSGYSWGSAHFTKGKGDTIWITTTVWKLRLSSRPRTTRPPRCSPRRACYHTRLDTFAYEDVSYGIIGRVVGAPFAVLVAEELFASGGQLLISITSAGQILPLGPPPYVILIKKAQREMVCAQCGQGRLPPHVGASWTTDAPFRETEAMIARCRAKGTIHVQYLVE